MSIITIVLSTLVAFEFFYIMYLETFATTSSATSRVFGMSQEKLAEKEVNVLFKNQGIYNGLIGILILIAVFIVPSLIWVQILMAFIILVAIYGGVTSNPAIILKQGGLAILTLIVSLF